MQKCVTAPGTVSRYTIQTAPLEQPPVLYDLTHGEEAEEVGIAALEHQFLGVGGAHHG